MNLVKVLVLDDAGRCDIKKLLLTFINDTVGGRRLDPPPPSPPSKSVGQQLEGLELRKLTGCHPFGPARPNPVPIHSRLPLHTLGILILKLSESVSRPACVWIAMTAGGQEAKWTKEALGEEKCMRNLKWWMTRRGKSGLVTLALMLAECCEVASSRWFAPSNDEGAFLNALWSMWMRY